MSAPTRDPVLAAPPRAPNPHTSGAHAAGAHTRPSHTSSQHPPEPQADPAWTTLCVYAHLDAAGHDALIRDCVVPLAETAVEDGDAEGWFFLRYWHGGPHVRLRLRGAGPEVLDHVESEVSAWLREHGSRRTTIREESFRGQFGVTDPRPWREHGELVREDYLPETDRYGGPESMAACERFFQTSSRVAGAALRLGDRDKVFALALDLMVLALRELQPDDLAAARSARRYFLSWDFVAETAPNRSAALQHAEALQRGFARTWGVREERVLQAAATAPGSTHGIWRDSVRELVGQLRTLDGAGALTRPPEAVLWSLVHMMNNRLGLSVHEERVLSWLASRACTRWWVPEDYFADEADAADRAYLERSKYAVPVAGADQQPRFAALSADRTSSPVRGSDAAHAPHATPVPLPGPSPLLMPLDDVLAARESSYGDYGGSMALDDLATVLAHGAGANPRRPVETPYGTFHRRTYPSPGALYATGVLVNVWDVTGLDPGLYLYRAEGHELVPIGPPLARATLAGASPGFLPGGSADHTDGIPSAPGTIPVDTVPVVLLLVGDLPALRPKYGLRALRLLLQEAGHLAQNLVLAATALGCPSVPVSAFSDDDLSTAVHLDGIDRFVATVVPLGTARPPVTPRPPDNRSGTRHTADLHPQEGTSS